MQSAVTSFHHVNITVRPEDEAQTKHFYSAVLGLREVPKPEASRARGGAWYQLGPIQIHLSRENGVINDGAKRHFCLLVNDMDHIKERLRSAGVDILPDEQPAPNNPRFFVRDPGGNRIEIAFDQRG
jgi:catechol 2,3-dioxygenase-like lactoylglutathione lyase family enzyme